MSMCTHVREQEGSQARPRRKRGLWARVTCRVRGATPEKRARHENAPAKTLINTGAPPLPVLRTRGRSGGSTPPHTDHTQGQ
eukprot:scaffold76429_cov63-Phaeocystis_antarctica.AAC.1